jgi:predicted 3-demethylubiquinone-9 3-methyltransferase (glyoxalase superfamily)
MSQGLNSIVSLVDHLNFNEKIPEHHNFYVSAINDKHVNTIDTKTKNIVKESKKDLFDKILFNHMNKLERAKLKIKDF